MNKKQLFLKDVQKTDTKLALNHAVLSQADSWVPDGVCKKEVLAILSVVVAVGLVE